MTSRQTACGRAINSVTRGESLYGLSSWRDGVGEATPSVENNLEWSDACGRDLADKNLAPAGATHTHKGLFYKKGRGGHMCYWNGGDWVRSSKRESLLADLYPYRRVLANFSDRCP